MFWLVDFVCILMFVSLVIECWVGFGLELFWNAIVDLIMRLEYIIVIFLTVIFRENVFKVLEKVFAVVSSSWWELEVGGGEI